MAIHADTLEDTLAQMRKKLAAVVPDFELQEKAELVYEINRLKKERKAIILGHNYMEPALYHTVPDVVGDSLKLAQEAARTDAEIIVMCGVRFMAESAKLLNPNKQVLIPARIAGCSLASSITAEDIRALRRQYPGVPVVTYINTYAAVKAECDVCCTSSNAAKIVESLHTDTVIMVPDQFLAQNVARETGKKIIFPNEKVVQESAPVMIGWKGRCEVHEKFTVDDIKNVRAQFPDVVVLAHPECPPEVVEAADFSGSTTKMVEFVRATKSPRFLLLTECAMADNIIAENPEKEVLRLCSIRCPHMNEITLQDTLASLRLHQYEVTVPEEVRRKAKTSLDRMLAVH